MGGGGQGACMPQAGIEKSVMEQIHSIVHDAHSQVESVCSNSSLTPQQKQQHLREIRERAMQKRESLMTADQQMTRMACQLARNGNHAGAGGPHEGRPHEGLEWARLRCPTTGSRPGGSPTGHRAAEAAIRRPRTNPRRGINARQRKHATRERASTLNRSD